MKYILVPLLFCSCAIVHPSGNHKDYWYHGRITLRPDTCKLHDLSIVTWRYKKGFKDSLLISKN